jgi:hypothetical protein
MIAGTPTVTGQSHNTMPACGNMWGKVTVLNAVHAAM